MADSCVKGGVAVSFHHGRPLRRISFTPDCAAIADLRATGLLEIRDEVGALLRIPLHLRTWRFRAQPARSGEEASSVAGLHTMPERFIAPNTRIRHAAAVCRRTRNGAVRCDSAPTACMPGRANRLPRRGAHHRAGPPRRRCTKTIAKRHGRGERFVTLRPCFHVLGRPPGAIPHASRHEYLGVTAGRSRASAWRPIS